MSKQIQVSDSLYKRLKGAADAHYRSLGGEIEYMMDFIGGRNGAREEVSGHGVWIPDGHIANKQPKPEDNVPPAVIADMERLKNNFGASPNVSDLMKAPGYDPAVAERQLSGELTCCQHPTRPCKHWQWDTSTGEGYKNILSGRYREAD